MPVQPWRRVGGDRSPRVGDRRLRVLLIDDHEISRGACGALLRTEGVEVVGEMPLRDATTETVLRLAVDIVVIDLTPGDDASIELARSLQARANGPAIVLTSSAEESLVAGRLGGIGFVAKADLCAGLVAAAAGAGRKPAASSRNCRQADPDHLQTS